MRVRVSAEDGSLITEAEGQFRPEIARCGAVHRFTARAEEPNRAAFDRKRGGCQFGRAPRRELAAPASGARLGLRGRAIAASARRALLCRAALQPFAELRRGGIEELLKHDLAVLVLDDVGALTQGEVASLTQWIDRGGVLLRFAGPHLAENAQSDTLLPVRLRVGGRVLGGALSWEQPAKLAAFSDASPFKGLAVPPDVTVSRQVLAEPTIDLGGKTWSRLTDGTPLVTADQRGDGWIVLVHTTANADWSNLALSGLFVDMLRRVVAMSAGVAEESAEGVLAPLETLDGFGRLGPAASTAMPLAPGELSPKAIGPRHPPGYYGSSISRRVLNLGPLVRDTVAMAPLPLSVRVASYGLHAERALMPMLLSAALVILLIDMAISLALRGYLSFATRRAAAILLPLLLLPAYANAQTLAPEGPDGFALTATTTTKLAYVRTGDAELDRLSEAGLYGLSLVLNRRTAAEELAPLGVDLEKDELSFFPLLYWPIDPSQPALSEQAIRKLNDYMKNGGMVLFDTRDQASGGQGLHRLRELAQGLDIPPLVAMPPDHVLTKSFYLLSGHAGPLRRRQALDRGRQRPRQ